MLTEESGERTEVFNKGHPGDRVWKSRAERLPGFFDDESKADRALLLIGTNDSHEFYPTLSGLGCGGSVSCDGTYKSLMESVIDDLKGAGRETIYVGMLPPTWGLVSAEPYPDPLDLAASPRNARIYEYNLVISDTLLKIPGVRPGPDFFSCFLSPTVNRYSLFTDTLHPNKLGYVFMAALWRNAVLGNYREPQTSPCTAPIYVLESLDPYVHGHKQDLLEVDDEYYTDESFTLTHIPDELVNGIWIIQANADKNNSEPDFLNFDSGTTPVTVYIAYDPQGEPPKSTSHSFDNVRLGTPLVVTDPDVGEFAIYKAVDVTGLVAIGGNQSGNYSESQQQGYLVIVVP
jgi:lysophospholipase L1-like esterase